MVKALQVGRTRDRFQAVTLGIYSVAADISVCPGVDSASKNEYQDIPGGKGGRCVRATTLPPSCAECLVIWSINRPEPSGPHRPVIGVALHLPFTTSFNIQKFCVLPTMHLCILRGSENKQRLFLYTALTYRFLKPKHRLFTARYEMGL